MSVNNIYATAPTGGGPAVTVPTTTAIPPCVPSYIGITLKAGEKFILPAGATIVSSTAGASALTSKDDCADLTKVEVPECYLVAWGGNYNLNNATQIWTNDNTVFTGITMGGTFFGSGNIGILNDQGGGDPGGMVNWINNHPTFKNIIQCIGTGSSSDLPPASFFGGQARGGIGTLCFKTVPSIADSLYFHVFTEGAGGSGNLFQSGGGSGPVSVLIKPIKAANFTGANGKCGCAC